uniref:Uncharacterized protein n=1 Tax=Oryza meridionalis TaxID=40149 RepID=A0A0E0DMM4_9ORYZ
MAARRSPAAAHHHRLLLLLLYSSALLIPLASAYRPGDIVPMLRSGQYHGVMMPIPKPTGFTGADPYKITFQIGHEKFHLPWLYVINRKSSEVPMIDFHLKYSGNDLLGVTAKVVDMPHIYVEHHPDIRKNFWDQQNWPKYVLVRYTWEEQSEIDVPGGFYVLFGSGLVLSFILAIYVLQSSQEKLTRFVREAVNDSSLPEGGFAKVE